MVSTRKLLAIGKLIRDGSKESWVNMLPLLVDLGCMDVLEDFRDGSTVSRLRVLDLASEHV